MVLLVAALWRMDSVADSTVLLQHLRQIRQQNNLVQAASAFCCQLIAEACNHGQPPVITLQCMLEEVLFPLCTLHLYSPCPSP